MTIISRFAAYNAQSEGAFIHMPYENRGLNEKMGEKMVPGNRGKELWRPQRLIIHPWPRREVGGEGGMVGNVINQDINKNDA